jgi:hypothetical protein
MGDQQEQDAMPADQEASATGGWMAWCGSMFLFGVMGIVATVSFQRLVHIWCPQDEFRSERAWMRSQMEQLRNGEVNCLIDPDPRFIEELLAEPASAGAVRDVYLGGDLSDPLLGRLRDLPNLKCIVFVFADQTTAFLQRMHGATGITELSFEHTQFTRADVDQIASFPNLKSLGLGEGHGFGTAPVHPGDLDGLRGHPSLERLRGIGLPRGSEEANAILKSLPRLREPRAGNATTKK